MNKKLFKGILSGLVAALLLTSSLAVFAEDGIITPWNTKCDFNDSKYSINPTSDTWNQWPSTYVGGNAYANHPISARDSYTDSNGQIVYDNPTKTAGDKYLYFGVNNVEGTNTGKMTFNPVQKSNNTLSDFTKMNGGLSYGKVVYEVDVRLNEYITWNSPETFIRLYAYDATAQQAVTMISLTLQAKGVGWLLTGTGVETGNFKYGDWIHIKCTVDVPNGTYEVSCEPISGSTSASYCSGVLNIADSLKGFPACTSIELTNPKKCSTSIDNFSVTKETFIVDETKTSVSEDGSNVKASVTIGNDVYSSDEKYSDQIATVSPVVLFALYDKADKTLIDVDIETVTYEVSTHGASATTLKSAPDYKEISLSLPKPASEYEAKVFVWNQLGKMIPYTAPYEPEN